MIAHNSAVTKGYVSYVKYGYTYYPAGTLYFHLPSADNTDNMYFDTGYNIGDVGTVVTEFYIILVYLKIKYDYPTLSNMVLR